MTRSLRSAAVLGILALGGCDSLDVGDLNNPGLDELEQSPSRVGVNTAATGLLIGLRVGIAEPNGWIPLLAALGREGFNLNTTSDPRYIAEMFVGPLDPGSGAFGANFWGARYANIRNTVVVLNAVENVVEFTDEEKDGIRGFAKTIQALELLRVIVTRDDNGAVIDVDRPPTGEPGAIATKAEVYARIIALLDEGNTHLQNAGGEFSFGLGLGFSGFDAPPTFARVNRALRARVAVYRDDFAGALTALAQSFIDPGQPLSVGVYHGYGTGSGDLANNIVQGAAQVRANPDLLTAAQLRANGQPDLRVTSKIVTGDPFTGIAGTASITSDKHFTIYPSNTSPVPIIRNEELILLRAEANLGLGNVTQALVDINLIRTNAGGLPAYSGSTAPAAVLDELLYNKRYSLLWEGGHSWIDYRHYGKLTSLPRMVSTGKFFTKMPFPTNECLVRTPQPATGCVPENGI
ncbi:MAG TPA: RagB/SusD family nutrient uptake outer membrane protein [Gemmatimonadales bacterium]